MNQTIISRTYAAHVSTSRPHWHQPAVQSLAEALRWFADRIGLSEIRCRWKHKGSHRLHQIGFGGGYVVSCEQCRCVRHVNR
jgi:hypothetical protein